MFWSTRTFLTPLLQLFFLTLFACSLLANCQSRRRETGTCRYWTLSLCFVCCCLCLCHCICLCWMYLLLALVTCSLLASCQHRRRERGEYRRAVVLGRQVGSLAMNFMITIMMILNTMKLNKDRNTFRLHLSPCWKSSNEYHESVRAMLYNEVE